MQGCESIDVGGVDVGPVLDQLFDLLLVAGHAGGQENASRTELDLGARVLRRRRFAIRVRLLPALQLFGPLHQRRRVARVHFFVVASIPVSEIF